jgi:hypothetical protein
MTSLLAFVLIVSVSITLVLAASDKKAHHHTGILTPYTGEHIPYSITKEEVEKLSKGGHVTKLSREGKSGRGVIIQDVGAPPHVCMDRIRDLKNYKKVVPNLKSIDNIVVTKEADGTEIITSKWNVGVSLVGFTYFLKLRYDAKHNTYSWTLDYSKSSDFDDNTGFWQVLPHPQKGPDFARVVYSTEVKLFNWVPEFVVTFLTKTALISSTEWVKKESEKVHKTGKTLDGGPTESAPFPFPDLSPCFIKDSETGGERYDPTLAKPRSKGDREL